MNNQIKIPFAYKTVSWVAVGLLMTACSSTPPVSTLIPLQTQYKELVNSPDARLAEVSLYETEKILKRAETVEQGTLKGSN